MLSLDFLHSPIEASAWVSYMHRPGIVLPIVLGVAVFVVAFTGLRGMADTWDKKRGGQTQGSNATKATVVTLALALMLAVAAAYAAPLHG